jgi:amylosucrase
MREAFPVPHLSAGPDDVSAILSRLTAARADRDFIAGVELHLPRLHDLFLRLYGDRPDGRERLASVVDLAHRSWDARPAGLKALDLERASAPD